MARPNTFEDILSRLAVNENGCWEWLGHTSLGGYGRVKMRGPQYTVHRLVYETLVGPVPDGLELDHLCRNRRCANPAHLEPVTRRTNALRGIGFAAVNATKTHCKMGHPYDEGNTRIRKNGGRSCRACQRAWKEAHIARRAGAVIGEEASLFGRE